MIEWLVLARLSPMKSYLWLFFAFMLVATVGLTFGTHVPAQTDLPSLWSEGSARQGIIKLVQATPGKSGAGPAGLTEVIAGDAAAGRQVFKKCEACHSLEPGRNLVGPSLAGVVGRKAGSDPGYDYSPAMKQSGLIWSPATLDSYLTDPQKLVPGNKMPFPGLKTDRDRADVIALLSSGGGTPERGRCE